MTIWQVMSEYRWRVIGAMLFLVAAKVATVIVPLVLKRIVDLLSRPEQVLALPVYLLVGYALLRFSSTLFNELRDLLFARVKQRTVAAYALNVFGYLHAPDARFHSQRRIGNLLPDGQGVLDHDMAVGDLVLINAYVIQVCLPLNALGFIYRETKDALVYTERLFQLLRKKPEIAAPRPTRAPDWPGRNRVRSGRLSL